MSQITGDERLAAREAIERFDWQLAYELLTAADERGELGLEDLERLAFAATWARSIAGAVPYMERAYTASLNASEPRRAARSWSIATRSAFAGPSAPTTGPRSGRSARRRSATSDRCTRFPASAA